MQTVQRYLINQLVIAYISGYHGRNSKVYDRRLTLHRGVSNPISFTFKNEDQKAQDITSKTYEFNMIDSESKKAVLTKTLTILDDGSTVSTKGDASCTITEGDLLPLDAKFYNFSVREVKSDGSQYRDRMHTEAFLCLLHASVLMEPKVLLARMFQSSLAQYHPHDDILHSYR